MGSFTIPLKRVIQLTGNKIGLDAYPLFDEAYRPQLNTKIVDRYYNREIGLESVDMFQLAMRRKMNEIMPYFNQVYLSTKISFDPLSTVNLATISDAATKQNTDSTGTSGSTNASESKSRSVASDTPQTMLAANADYASSASDARSTSGGTATGTQKTLDISTGEQKGTTTVKGYQGLAADLLIRYRQSLINVDLAVLDELNELFMLIWDTGDSYTNRGYYYL